MINSEGSAWAAGATFMMLFTGIILLEGLDLGTAQASVVFNSKKAFRLCPNYIWLQGNLNPFTFLFWEHILMMDDISSPGCLSVSSSKGGKFLPWDI